MGVFDDKKFEQLDWMTQITETIESKLNEVLVGLPDRFVVDGKRLGEQMGNSAYFGLSVDSVIYDLMYGVHTATQFTYDERQMIINCFRFESDPVIEFSATTGEIKGTIVLVKHTPTLSDEQLQNIMGHKGINQIAHIALDDPNFDHMNEILDILGNCEAEKRNRSFNKKLRRITDRMGEIFKNNEWRIRDMELADRIGGWVAQYIVHGNLAALTNLCKLKIMTHNNMPIYSMEEER